MIIGLTGSFGAGKGTVVDYLTERKGFKHYSARELITEEIVRRNMPVNRDSMITVSNDLRAENGPVYIIETLFNRAQQNGGNAIIESIREVAGARFIKEQGGVVIGVDADSRLRYDRAFKRGGVTDNVTYETWLEQERKESNSGDPNKQDIFGALKESDFILTNDGSMEDLHAQIENVLTALEKSST